MKSNRLFLLCLSFIFIPLFCMELPKQNSTIANTKIGSLKKQCCRIAQPSQLLAVKNEYGDEINLEEYNQIESWPDSYLKNHRDEIVELFLEDVNHSRSLIQRILETKDIEIMNDLLLHLKLSTNQINLKIDAELDEIIITQLPDKQQLQLIKIIAEKQSLNKRLANRFVTLMHKRVTKIVVDGKNEIIKTYIFIDPIIMCQWLTNTWFTPEILTLNNKILEKAFDTFYDTLAKEAINTKLEIPCLPTLLSNINNQARGQSGLDTFLMANIDGLMQLTMRLTLNFHTTNVKIMRCILLKWFRDIFMQPFAQDQSKLSIIKNVINLLSNNNKLSKEQIVEMVTGFSNTDKTLQQMNSFKNLLTPHDIVDLKEVIVSIIQTLDFFMSIAKDELDKMLNIAYEYQKENCKLPNSEKEEYLNLFKSLQTIIKSNDLNQVIQN